MLQFQEGTIKLPVGRPEDKNFKFEFKRCAPKTPWMSGTPYSELRIAPLPYLGLPQAIWNGGLDCFGWLRTSAP